MAARRRTGGGLPREGVSQMALLSIQDVHQHGRQRSWFGPRPVACSNYTGKSDYFGCEYYVSGCVLVCLRCRRQNGTSG
eukprot:scaffold651874_cov39-Prasinocladus_malaysianus.AAC.1